MRVGKRETGISKAMDEDRSVARGGMRETHPGPFCRIFPRATFCIRPSIWNNRRRIDPYPRSPMSTPMMSDTITEGIRIGAAATYLRDESSPDHRKYVFGYRI